MFKYHPLKVKEFDFEKFIKQHHIQFDYLYKLAMNMVWFSEGEVQDTDDIFNIISGIIGYSILKDVDSEIFSLKEVKFDEFDISDDELNELLMNVFVRCTLLELAEEGKIQMDTNDPSVFVKLDIK